MKKFVLPLLLCLLMLCACSNDPHATIDDLDSKTVNVISSGDCFTIEEIQDGSVVRYRYTVVGQNGDVLETALCAERPLVSQVDADLIGMRFTDGNNRWTRYFDTKDMIVSESFINAFWSDGTLVAYFGFDGDVYMTVRSIFDDNGFCSVTTLDSMSWTVYVLATEVSEDGSELAVEYVEGKGTSPDAEIKTVTLPLTDIEEE